MKVLLYAYHTVSEAPTHIAQALRILGHEVQICYSNYKPDDGLRYHLNRRLVRCPAIWRSVLKAELVRANSRLTDAARQVDPDVILVTSVERLLASTLEQLRPRTSSRIVAWVIDCPDYLPNFQEAAHLYDFVFVGSPEWRARSRITGIGIPTHYLPYGYNPDVYRPTELPDEEARRCGSDVVFVGTRYSDRETALSQIADMDLAIYGWDSDTFPSRIRRNIIGKHYIGSVDRAFGVHNCTYPKELNPLIRSGPVPPDTVNRIYNASRVALNIQHPQMKAGLNAKTFEIAGTGTFQLINRRGPVPQLLRLKEELVTYETPEELRRLVEYFLKHPDEREDIAGRAQKTARSRHTFAHRLRELFEVLCNEV